MFILLKNFLWASVLLGLSAMVMADDIDIIKSGSLKDANVLFVMDLSGSMRWSLNPDDDDDDDDDGSGPTRLDVLRDAFQTIIADPDFDEANFGLSVFSGSGVSVDGSGVAHGISFPVSPLVDQSAQDSLNANSTFTHKSTSYMPAVPSVRPPNIYMTRDYLNLISSDTSIWRPGGSTPIVDALFEAAQYFRADEVKWGRYPADDVRSAHPSTYTGSLSVAASAVTSACTVAERIEIPKGTGGITESCSTNYARETRADSTGGFRCDVNKGNRQDCSEGVSVCGLGTNCAVQPAAPLTRICEASNSTIAACMSAHPNYHSCSETVDPNCSVNSEGQSICDPVTNIVCKEDVALYQCDSANTFTCDFPVETCTKCPVGTTANNVNGSATYKSPIVEECPKNGIILLTDGQPTVNYSAADVASSIGTYANGCSSGSNPGRCGPELVDFLYNEDHADGSTSGANNISGIQNVVTYPIGLALDSSTANYMQNLADKGQGKPAGQGVFVNATSGAGLTAAFKNALLSIAESKARSFSSPTYSIDTSTLLSHGEYVYVPVFDQDKLGWPGNIKKYKLVNGALTDADNNLAIDVDGTLIDTARDYWSSTPSDDAVTSGGAANKLPSYTRRKAYTDAGVNGFPANLISNKLNRSNSKVSKSILGNASMSSRHRRNLIDFVRGRKNDGSRRNFMGGIIHSKAAQLEMSNGRKLIFVGSNEGYLHAINDYANVKDRRNGTEAFAFMPRELLKNIDKQYTHDNSDGHIYGVDSPITIWIDERTSTNPVNVNNGVLDAGEKAYLFFGLRRGGSAYYALEVTNPDRPKLIWRKDSSSTGFEALANTWSQPVITTLKWNKTQSKPEPALVFGGGYSELPDSDTEVANKGNAVYIVNAITGDKIWSTKKAEETSAYSPDGKISNAIPSRIRVLDVDRNGSADRLYFGDTGGNIWRVDLNDSNFNTITTDDDDITKAKLYKFADLGGVAPKRKFFEEPDVAIFKRNGRLVTSIAIGSGSRPTPLEVGVSDKFFVLFDNEVIGARASTSSTFTSSDSGLKNSLGLKLADTIEAGFKGWYKDLADGNGEKVLSTAVTHQNKVMFTTFQGVPTVTDQCGPTNLAQLYVMDLHSGTVQNKVQAATGQILGTPQIIVEGLEGTATNGSGTGGACTVGDCKPKRSIRIGSAAIPLDEGSAGINSLPRVYWINN